jgi:ABC-type lipoprotein export system ATPase subunit
MQIKVQNLKNQVNLVDKESMVKVNFEENFEIYLFTDNEHENNFSKLNEFLSFLKFNKVSLPYRFSYVCRSDGLMPELTLNENILMDFSPDSLTTAREFQFKEFLKEQPNRDLEKLYHKLTFPHELPEHSDAQMKKMASLIKALISESQFIFLEEPEKDLDSECFNLFISALTDHIARYKQNVFIFSNRPKLWINHCHQLVKREEDYSFNVIETSKKLTWFKDRDHFFKPITTPLENELLFHLPKKLTVKKSVA